MVREMNFPENLDLYSLLYPIQGILVSLLYCFISSDVRDAIRREYRRFSARRSANSIRASQIRKKSVIKNGSASVVLRMTTLSRNNCSAKSKSNPTALPNKQTYFKSNLLLTGRGTAESSMRSQSPSPETGINYFQNDSPLLDTPGLDYGGGTPLTDVVAPMLNHNGNGRCICDKSLA